MKNAFQTQFRKNKEYIILLIITLIMILVIVGIFRWLMHDIQSQSSLIIGFIKTSEIMKFLTHQIFSL